MRVCLTLALLRKTAGVDARLLWRGSLVRHRWVRRGLEVRVSRPDGRTALPVHVNWGSKKRGMAAGCVAVAVAMLLDDGQTVATEVVLTRMLTKQLGLLR